MEQHPRAGSYSSSPSRGAASLEIGDAEAYERLEKVDDSTPLTSPLPDPELDGDDRDPIAICGFALKFPQEATSPEALWKMMVERRCAMTEFPEDRINADGFYSKKNRMNTVRRHPLTVIFTCWM